MAVFRIHVGIGQLFLQHLIEPRGGIGFQLRPEGQVRRLVGEDVAVGYGIHIEPGAADEEGHIPAGNDAVDGLIGEALEIRHGEEFPGLADIEQVMGDAAHLLRRDFAGTEIQPLENLAGVGGDDFPPETGGKLHPERTLSGGVRSLNDNQLRQHGRIPPNPKDSVHRASYHRMGGGTNPNPPKTAVRDVKTRQKMPQNAGKPPFQRKKA